MRHTVLACLLALAGPLQAEEITVFAAASLKAPLDAVAQDWTAATGHGVTISYGGSSALARQIEQGAPADVFLSASVAWMDKLAEAQLIEAATRADFFGNSLVLIAADPKAAPVRLEAGTDLKALLAGGKLAMALVDSVPAGQYGKEALTSLGLWSAAEPHVAQASDVQAALRLVTSGEASYGIVYASDAQGAGLTPVARFPAMSHSAITYPGALIKGARPEAAAFLAFLQSPVASQHFTDAGFALLP